MPRKTDSNNPRHWVEICEEDLEGIRLLATNETSYRMCQGKLAEVLEKLLKADLIRLGWPLLKTHDLGKLMDELHSRDAPFAKEADPIAQALAEVYFTNRYPGFDSGEPDWDGLRQLVEQVAALLAKVKARIPAEK
ncbi:MAG: HEPN domain-containing protein [Verrucomicrobia bacterium]|nr:HEPN domain-containing protein [Verrucomicrobiota bacterium]